MNKWLPRIFLLCIAGSLPACASPYPRHYTAEAIEAKVVDADSKQPLAGVVVVAHWPLLGGFEGNRPIAQMMVLETVSDPNGRVYVSAWGPLKRPKGYIRHEDPELLFFKPGYHYRVLANRVEGSMGKVGEPLRRSDWNGKTVEMKKFTGTAGEYAEHVYSLDGDLEWARYGEDCEWKKIPRMLVAVHRLSEQFESQGILLKGWRGGARIRKITNVGKQGQCGSAKEFFMGYLP